MKKEGKDQDSKELTERVAELERVIDELENNLIHDKLTGLKTRAYFEQEVGVYLEVILRQYEMEKHGTSERRERFGFRNLSVIFLDLDHFKAVNDAYGHDIGDTVLMKVAETIKADLRTGDTVARWGGEEIVVSLLGANEQDAAEKAEEIRERVEKLDFPETPETKGLSITISAGVASAERGLDLQKLVKRADLALYESKKGGRNRTTTYSEMMKLQEPVLANA